MSHADLEEECCFGCCCCCWICSPPQDQNNPSWEQSSLCLQGKTVSEEGREGWGGVWWGGGLNLSFIKGEWASTCDWCLLLLLRLREDRERTKKAQQSNAKLLLSSLFIFKFRGSLTMKYLSCSISILHTKNTHATYANLHWLPCAAGKQNTTCTKSIANNPDAFYITCCGWIRAEKVLYCLCQHLKAMKRLRWSLQHLYYLLLFDYHLIRDSIVIPAALYAICTPLHTGVNLKCLT